MGFEANSLLGEKGKGGGPVCKWGSSSGLSLGLPWWQFNYYSPRMCLGRQSKGPQSCHTSRVKGREKERQKGERCVPRTRCTVTESHFACARHGKVALINSIQGARPFRLWGLIITRRADTEKQNGERERQRDIWPIVHQHATASQAERLPDSDKNGSVAPCVASLSPGQTINEQTSSI